MKPQDWQKVKEAEKRGRAKYESVLPEKEQVKKRG